MREQLKDYMDTILKIMKLYDEMLEARRRFFASFNIPDGNPEWADVTDCRGYRWKLIRDTDSGFYDIWLYEMDRQDYKFLEKRVVNKYSVGDISLYGCVDFWTHDGYGYIMLDDTKKTNNLYWRDVNGVKKLVTIQRVDKISDITGSDDICVYQVSGVPVIDMKGKYEVGELVVYFGVDSFLPIRPEFEFLRKRSYKRFANGVEGFRIRSIKLRGQVSEGILAKIPDQIKYEARIGEDVSEYFGVTKV